MNAACPPTLVNGRGCLLSIVLQYWCAECGVKGAIGVCSRQMWRISCCSCMYVRPATRISRGVAELEGFADWTKRRRRRRRSDHTEYTVLTAQEDDSATIGSSLMKVFPHPFSCCSVLPRGLSELGPSEHVSFRVKKNRGRKTRSVAHENISISLQPTRP